MMRCWCITRRDTFGRPDRSAANFTTDEVGGQFFRRLVDEDDIFPLIELRQIHVFDRRLAYALEIDGTEIDRFERVKRVRVEVVARSSVDVRGMIPVELGPDEHHRYMDAAGSCFAQDG